MSKKRVSVRGKGLSLLTKAPTEPGHTEQPSREIETKKSRSLYQQGNFQLFPEQAKRIRLYAAQKGMKVSEVVRQALEEFFKDKDI